MDEENTNTENTGAEETPAAEAPAATETATAEAAPAGDDGGDGKRPVFLTVLCILTFIGSGLGILTTLLLLVGVGALAEMMGGMGGGMLGGGTAYLAVSLVLAAASLFGALQMWKLKKMGFYLYVGAQLIAAILPLVWLGSAFAILGFLWPVVFIVLYGLNLKHMS